MISTSQVKCSAMSSSMLYATIGLLHLICSVRTSRAEESFRDIHASEEHFAWTGRYGYQVWWPPSSTRNVEVPRDFPPKTPFFRPYAVVFPSTSPSDTSGKTNHAGTSRPNITYNIVSVKSRGELTLQEDFEDLFLLDPETQTLMLNRSLQDHSVTEFIVTLEGSIGGENAKSWSLLVRVGSRNCQTNPRKACFLQRHYEITIPDTIPANTTLETLRPVLSDVLCPGLQLRYGVQQGSDFISVDETDGTIRPETALNWNDPSMRVQDLIVQCNVTRGKSVTSSQEVGVAIRLQDIDDNPPRPQHEKNLFCSTRVLKLDKNAKLDCEISVLDADSLKANKFEVQVVDDPLGLFTVRDPPTIHFVREHGQTFLAAEIYPKSSDATFPGVSYSFKVVVEDVGLVTREDNNKVVFEIEVVNATVAEEPLELRPVYNATVSRRAALFARVTPALTSRASGYRFRQVSDDASGKSCSWLAVTPRTGIVYVADAKHLRTCNKPTMEYDVQVTWPEGAGPRQEVFTVHVEVVDGEGSAETEHCGIQCAVHPTSSDCVKACGLGSANGLCHWRNGSARAPPSRDYTTCTSDESFCPDGVCDELETMQPTLCPQDCAKHVVGEVVEGVLGRGIHKAVGLCTCATTQTCTCGSDGHIQTEKDKDKAIKDAGKPPTSSLPGTAPDIEPLAVVGVAGPAGVTCGSGCAATLLLVSCSAAGAAGVAMLTFLRRRRQRRQQMAAGAKHKLVGNSRVSLTPASAVTAAVPSDYVHDVRTDSQAAMEAAALAKVDAKWEFPREHLIFEKTLGEGEFGKVVRAQAFHVGDIPGYTTVAVKMLKGNGTAAEEQDLLSEFNMLKEVNHPNVIKLLGACTLKGGPLYVIVEYAEHGSLLNVLRRSRNVTTDESPETHISAVCNPTYMSDGTHTAPPTAARPKLGQRDLLSYAWQIAKGMAYLTDIKLIHRDLAARNILIAAGNMVKISDFGLSRDVYEGDTYLKKSKGRVPVKWMALESLEDHIYTTKSDVWSYGIVLWEIVTLGATPYPGVSPEHLFQLLKQGYRMFQPENCLDEIYQIMRSCWRSRPQERPSFKELTQKFEMILQDSALYLDLNRTRNRDYYNLEFRPPSTLYPGEDDSASINSAADDEPLQYGEMDFASDTICPLAEDTFPCQEERISLLADTMVLADTQQSPSCATTCLHEGPRVPIGTASQV
ncbi:proto-oncogene tyrosine-protein kinase receptor Ret-like isoform X2 [Ornithodoros turicata]|uniref:proto-oncogene tyrosine-protein kinase receptor Ret-like isoform X2 n=1 Tax=Ornithodoros turicata TaxID=34597 RepID=UPI003138CCE5